MKQEIWKDIEGYENIYQVSSMGRIRSFDRWVKRRYNTLQLKKGKILKPCLDKYERVCLVDVDGHRHNYTIHRLVAQAFIPNPDNKPHVDHINTIKTDNRVENLRWVTHKENCNNPITIKNKSGDNHPKPMLGKYGREHIRSKPIIQFTLNGELVRKWECFNEVERELGIHHSNICNVITGKRSHAGGFRWEYYDNDRYLIAKMIKHLKKNGIVLKKGVA